MKTINCFDDCLDYVNRMGAVKVEKGPGWIPEWQRIACNICDKILAMSGQDSWYHKTFQPITVEYKRKEGRFMVCYYGVSVIAGFVCID